MKRIPNFYPDQQCFFCGPRNEAGLKLEFYIDEEREEVRTEYLPSYPFKGLGNILHGGIQGGLFDEIMGWTAHYLTGEMGVTTELHITFHRPVYLGREVRITSRISSREDPYIHLEAELSTADDGALCSSARSTYRLFSEERFQALVTGAG